MYPLHRFGEYVTNINLFDNNTNDEHKKRNGIISTRSYIILLILLLAGYTLYTSLSHERSIIIIRTPTQKQYEELQSKFSSTLECPCQNISILYEKFLDMKPSYHEICSSDFVSQRWIDFLFHENVSYYFQLDFRHSAFAQFQILRTLCEQAKKLMNESLIEFYSNKYLTLQIVSNETFSIQTDSFIQLFQRTTRTSFQNIIQLFRYMIINNRLFSGLETKNFIMLMSYRFGSSFWGDMKPISYHETSEKRQIFDCYNGVSKISKLPEGIYANLNRYDYAGSSPTSVGVNATTLMINATIVLPGLFVGCLPIESLLQSTTECFYKKTCLHEIITHVNQSNSFSILNTSQFSVKTTIETLMNELFIEEWLIKISFDQYFQECKPLFCQYREEKKNNGLYIFIAVITFYGGLTLVLRSLVPIIIKRIRKRKQRQQTNINVTSDYVPLKTRLHRLVRKAVGIIIKHNKFNSHSRDESIQRRELIVTRIYFIALVSSLMVFGVYISIESQINTITIYEPEQNQFEELSKSHVSDLQCPCSQISIRYNKLITFRPTYHPICSSAFVSDLWYDNNYWTEEEDNFEDYDFRSTAYQYFSLLSKLCDLVNDTIENSLIQFYAREFITTQIIEANIFHDQFLSFTDLFYSTTRQSFKQTLDILRSIIFNNHFISSINAKGRIVVEQSSELNNKVQWYVQTYEDCSCAINSTCKRQLSFRVSPSTEELVSGMYISCYTVDSLLLTTTECFFDEECILRIKSYMNAYTALYQILEPMNISQINRYKSNTSIEMIVDYLFIEDWNVNYSYEKYYNQCKPSYCQHSIHQRPAFLYIISQLIGLVGGLSLVLRISGRITIHIITRERQPEQQRVISIGESIRIILQSIRAAFVNLNLFSSSSTNARTIQQERLTTKVYLIILSISLSVLILYTAIKQISLSTTVALSSQSRYEKLQIEYSNRLHCPCSQISIEYKEFIQISPSYHQICSSSFVSNEWINYLYNVDIKIENNFRSLAPVQFLTLRSLCQLSEETINTSLVQFHTTKFINTELISSKLFQIESESFVESFKRSTPKTFQRKLDLVHQLTENNAFMSFYQTNWKFTILDMYDLGPVYTNPQFYDNLCNCATSKECSQPAIITEEFPSGLPGLVIGCYPFQSMLQSSLECLYNQTCFNIIMRFFNTIPSNRTFSILNTSLTDLYNLNETVQHMVDRLFVNQWHINKSYEKYFQKCQALQCTYSYTPKFDLFFIIATILGLYGGLSRSLKIVLPFFAHIIIWIFNRRSTPVTSAGDSQNVVQ